MSNCEARIEKFGRRKAKRQETIKGHGEQTLRMIREHSQGPVPRVRSAAARRAEQFGNTIAAE